MKFMLTFTIKPETKFSHRIADRLGGHGDVGWLERLTAPSSRRQARPTEPRTGL